MHTPHAHPSFYDTQALQVALGAMSPQARQQVLLLQQQLAQQQQQQQPPSHPPQ